MEVEDRRLQEAAGVEVGVVLACPDRARRGGKDRVFMG